MTVEPASDELIAKIEDHIKDRPSCTVIFTNLEVESLIARIRQQEERIKRLELERDIAFAGQDRLKSVGSQRIRNEIAHATERLERQLAEREERIKVMDEALVQKRLCVLCGKEWKASIYKRGDTPCGADMPCTLDMTDTEALHYWRQKWHDDFAARAALKQELNNKGK